ncbi:MAG: Rne/Rng family ribonuclease [Methylocystis sp.]|uniref:Rne/Rng family ribonuclease n=1 Tax=Methylocystis sp. TaxID=1911079 RepID=UPI003930E50B
MANKMLIDASHPEETRVVVLRGNRVQEFDFEAADKKPLRGNIYLAKVTRVEPSLQAAFVDYGGNRHGFLAFAEIHPDYYQIPVADRQALLEEESRAHQQAEEEERAPHGRDSRDGRDSRGRRSRRRQYEGAEKRANPDEAVTSEPLDDAVATSIVIEDQAETGFADAPGVDAEAEAAVEVSSAAVESEAPAAEPVAADVEAQADSVANATGVAPGEEAEPTAPLAQHEQISIDPAGFGSVETGEAEEFVLQAPEPDHELKARRQDERDAARERAREDSQDETADLHARVETPVEEHDEEEHDDEEDQVEHIGGDAMDEAPYRAPRARRQYKIQEVIKRRQVLLVQVVKEERGNKGAALTTYLSLAGRYSVLMPNTARGGGISRKITDGADRKRLKEIVHDLEVPEGMGVILRTAGATRTKQEVKRDFEYLLRLWESVRELTLRSSAPTLVYEEGSLIKRAIRDLYGRDVEEVVVSGDDAYREAKDFMRMLMPSHAKNVRPHREQFPIFAESGVEAQLDAMFSNHVTLKSGGYLVINQTEALVAIDVNSGRSTREHNIEDTALRTNLEAADEVARQLRLRDLAGLIVVDFIDMEESRNNRAVERRLKDALKSDRARIQVGRISHFGLLEMSRQRIRAGVVEGSTVPCPHCAGAGHVRSTASIALHVLRVLEEALVKSAAHDVTLRTRAVVALYILNQKRAHLQDLESRFGVHITVAADDTLTGATYHALERGELATGPRVSQRDAPLRVDSVRAEPLEEEAIEDSAAGEAMEAEEEGTEASGEPRRNENGGRSRFAAEDDAASRGRRRRRRRGRGGAPGGEPQAPGIEQPSDEGLAFMAAIEGAPAPAEERPDRRGGRRGAGRSPERGPGRWRRSAPLPEEFKDPSALFPLDEAGEAAQAPTPSYESATPEFSPAAPVNGNEAAPPVDDRAREISAEIAPSEPPAPAPQPVAPQPAVQREATEVVITEADPNRPKKGGWWQRVRTPFGG